VRSEWLRTWKLGNGETRVSTPPMLKRLSKAIGFPGSKTAATDVMTPRFDE